VRPEGSTLAGHLALRRLCGESTDLRIPASSNAWRGAHWNSVRVAFGVLVVDDNRLFLETARDLLEREGLRVVGVAATAAQALQRTAELRPDIVLVDIRLGDESGFDVAWRLAEHDRGGGAAVILISTHSEADFADLIAESPAAGFLSKGDLSADAIRRIVDGSEPGEPPGARKR
jgi:DNA-binding NarL/FixJ family response regulator